MSPARRSILPPTRRASSLASLSASMAATSPVADTSARKAIAMIDFSLSPELAALRERVATFIRDEVIPEEQYVDDHDGLPLERLQALREKAREAGLYAPHVAK